MEPSLVTHTKEDMQSNKNLVLDNFSWKREERRREEVIFRGEDGDTLEEIMLVNM